MKSLAFILAVAVATTGFSSHTAAVEPQPPAGSDSKPNEQAGEKDGSNRKNEDGKIGKRKRGGRKGKGPRGGGPRGGGPGGEGPRGGGFPFDPAQLAERLMSKFDADGDSLLNADELTELLAEMQQRREMGRRGGPGGRPGGPGRGDEMRRGGPGPGEGGPNGRRGKKGKGGKGKGRRQQEPVGDVGGDAPIRPGDET